MMKKVQDKKKKAPSTANLFLKVNEKNDKINLKFALNMYVPRTSGILASPKVNEVSKQYKFKISEVDAWVDSGKSAEIE